MADNNLLCLGRIFGLVSVGAMIPAYLVGSQTHQAPQRKRAPT